MAARKTKKKPALHVKPGKAGTITFAELQRLSFCNSKKLPPIVNLGELAREWVGFGWVEKGPANADKYPTVVE